MFDEIPPFLIHWAITSISLWAASHVFKGLKFASTSALIVSALILGFANAIVKPLLIILTLPLTILTFGLFLLVINALIIQLVAKLVDGFSISDFRTALVASLFISLLSILLGAFMPGVPASHMIQMPHSGMWL